MYRFFSAITLCLLFLMLSCASSAPPKEEGKGIVLESSPFDPSIIDQMIVDFLNDTTLTYEGAHPHLDAGLLEYQRIENAAGLQKIYKYHKSMNGTRERLFLWDTNKENLLFIEEKRVRKACPDLDRNCMIWRRCYFSEGQVELVKVFQDTIADGTYPSFDHGEPLPIGDASSYNTSLLESFQKIRAEGDTINWNKGVRLQGEFLYFADASSFSDCQDGHNYDVASTFLESAFVELSTSGDMTPALTEVIGYYTPLSNMENILRPHLVALELIEMRPGEKCP
ncbi:MAG: hypothetical protein KTR30_19200 [Saprospiraceae bacterium]|nr:hypothetical protein [Saprospiraceae bacterium]